ncbi:DMT family transporter [Thalassobacillus hwangdonensis]|uniref:DMT family transporter n=1 Tax=Thalassobacillus hwangdonensis TaxID=546108 RepID=A0ABW3L116_9BACI
MPWVALLIAGVCEMFGVLLINRLHDKKNWQSLFLLALAFSASFIFLAYALEHLPMSTAYAIWTGIGACGGAILGMIYYDEPKEWKRLLFIGVILASTLGLKLLE